MQASISLKSVIQLYRPRTNYGRRRRRRCTVVFIFAQIHGFLPLSREEQRRFSGAISNSRNTRCNGSCARDVISTGRLEVVRREVEERGLSLLCPRRCTKQVAGRTPEQVFTKTARPRGPLPFLTFSSLPPLCRGTPGLVSEEIPRAHRYSFSISPFRVFLVGSCVRIVRRIGAL